MKILVTGAKGQLGKKIIELMSGGFELILTDTDNMDITNQNQVNEVFDREKPNFVIHGAAYTQVDKAEDNEEICRKVNALGTKNIAEAAEKINSTLVYISTDYVFDGQKRTPYNEKDEPNPLSVYGRTKLEGEEFIREICDKFYIVRSAWIFGELPQGHPGTNFVETMLRLAKEKESLSIVDDQIGSPTYTDDLVEIMQKLIKTEPESGIYHFSGEGECSWYDFAKEIFKQSDIEIPVLPITSDEYPQKAKRPAYSYLDKSKIKNVLGIEVKSWQEMLKNYFKHR